MQKTSLVPGLYPQNGGKERAWERAYEKATIQMKIDFH